MGEVKVCFWHSVILVEDDLGVQVYFLVSTLVVDISNVLFMYEQFDGTKLNSESSFMFNIDKPLNKRI